MQSITDKLNPKFKPPPTALEAEYAILSVIIRDRIGMEIAAERGIDKSYFQSVMNQNIYLAIKCLEDDGKDLDIVSIKTYLQKTTFLME